MKFFCITHKYFQQWFNKHVILQISSLLNFQLNIERSTKRRPPQQMSSIAQPFDPNTFNFNKVNDSEILIKCNYRWHNQNEPDGLITFLINNSPLTKYHSLICPNLIGNLSQILTKQSICFAVDVLQGFDDKYYRIGYNSLGAFASVNHLHLHLMYIESDLFIENVVSSKFSERQFLCRK